MTLSASPSGAVATAADVISTLAGIAGDPALVELRNGRPEATRHAQGSYDALFDPAETAGLTPCERFAVALRVAAIHEARAAVAHYRARLVAAGASPDVVAAAEATAGSAGDAAPARLQAMLAHADLLGSHPVDATPDALQALADAGLSTREIVTLSQIVAFLSFQVRVIAGLRLIAGKDAEDASATDAAAAATARPAVTRVAPEEARPPARVLRPEAPLKSPTKFTRDELEWSPWLEPLRIEDATEAHRAALEGRRIDSPYFRLLALDPTVLAERTATDMGIFYTHGGAPRAERELAAAATSRLNGCIYCASVHARRAAQLSRREADVDRLLDLGVESLDALGYDDRWAAIVDLSVNLARTPSTATVAHVEKLRALGLSELEILDVVQSAAFFSWANRLMLTLGEPYYGEATSA